MQTEIAAPLFECLCAALEWGGVGEGRGNVAFPMCLFPRGRAWGRVLSFQVFVPRQRGGLLCPCCLPPPFVLASPTRRSLEECRKAGVSHPSLCCGVSPVRGPRGAVLRWGRGEGKRMHAMEAISSLACASPSWHFSADWGRKRGCKIKWGGVWEVWGKGLLGNGAEVTTYCPWQGERECVLQASSSSPRRGPPPPIAC